MSDILNPSMLQGDDNIPGNTYAYYMQLTKPWIMSKGAMIAYYGQMQFQALVQGMQTAMMQSLAGTISAPLYMGDYVIAQGQGTLIIGDRGFDINSCTTSKTATSRFGRRIYWLSNQGCS